MASRKKVAANKCVSFKVMVRALKYSIQKHTGMLGRLRQASSARLARALVVKLIEK